MKKNKNKPSSSSSSSYNSDSDSNSNSDSFLVNISIFAILGALVLSGVSMILDDWGNKGLERITPNLSIILIKENNDYEVIDYLNSNPEFEKYCFNNISQFYSDHDIDLKSKITIQNKYSSLYKTKWELIRSLQNLGYTIFAEIEDKTLYLVLIPLTEIRKDNKIDLFKIHSLKTIVIEDLLKTEPKGTISFTCHN